MSIQDQIKKSLDKHTFNSRAIVAYVLFGAIILVFVLFGFPGSRGTLGQGAVAEVNGQLIAAADLKEESTRLERFYGQMFGGSFGMQGQRQFIERQALENLINREIMVQESLASGVLATDDEVRDFLFEIKGFQDRGRFDPIRYKQYLEGSRMAAQEFENLIRKDAQRMRLRRLFESSDRSATLQKKLQNEMGSVKLNIQFLKMDREAVIKAVMVPPAKIQEFLAAGDSLKKIEVDYETNKSSLYTNPEQVKAKHILIKVKEGDPQSDQASMTKISDLKARATKEDFSKLAAQFSEDEGSKSKGGDLGFFGRGQMVPAFEEAAFGAKVGDLVGPIKTPFGYHIIKVEGRKEQQVQSLDSVKTEIAKKLVAEKEVDEKLQALEAALAKNDGGTVDALVKTWNLKWEETGDFDLQADAIPKLDGNESVQEAAWSLQKTGQYLDHLVRDGSIRYALKLKELRNTPVSAIVTGADAPAANGNQGLFDAWIVSLREDYNVRKMEMSAQ